VNGVKFGGTSARNSGGNPELSLGPLFVAVSWSQCVAIRAQETQIIWPVVFVVPVYMVKLKRDRLIKPAVFAASSTPMRKNAFPEKSISQLVRLDRYRIVEVLVDRLSRREGSALVPSLACEM